MQFLWHMVWPTLLLHIKVLGAGCVVYPGDSPPPPPPLARETSPLSLLLLLRAAEEKRPSRRYSRSNKPCQQPKKRQKKKERADRHGQWGEGNNEKRLLNGKLTSKSCILVHDVCVGTNSWCTQATFIKSTILLCIPERFAFSPFPNNPRRFSLCPCVCRYHGLAH